MPRQSKQASYAANLRGTPLGTAVYQPLQMQPETKFGRVGDVAFFDEEGKYEWITNAFDREVHLHTPFLFSIFLSFLPLSVRVG
jgi:hypothetical protein